jgi:large subunit ribosomal protein L30
MEKVVVVQIRSHIGRNPSVKATLVALGLGAIGKKREVVLNPSVSGMIKKVAHLLSVTPAK